LLLLQEIYALTAYFAVKAKHSIALVPTPSSCRRHELGARHKFLSLASGNLPRS